PHISRKDRSMLPGRLIIVGLGNIGMTLVGTLSREFRLTCVDINEKTLEQVRKIWGESVETVQGDATSRLVLQKIGLAPVDTLAITTSSEEINLEVARVLHQHFPEVRVIGIGITQNGMREMVALGIEVEGIFAASATGLRNRLEHRAKTAHGIGIGKKEILEVEISSNSRLANKPLGWLRPKSWRFGLIYRDGNIVIPSKTAVLKPRDKVVILGEPRVLKTVAERLSSSLSDFPLDYGDCGLFLIDDRENEAFFSEIAYLASTLPLRRFILAEANGARIPDPLLQLIADKDPIRLQIKNRASPLEGIQSLLEQHPCNPGLCVMSPATLFRRRSAAGAKKQILDIFAKAGCPVLLANGSHPYEKIAAPCFEQHASYNALESALDMCADMYSSLDALLTVPSKYIGTENEGHLFQLLKKTVADVALAYRASIRRVELSGNPIHSFSQTLGNYHLQVVEISAATGGKPWQRLFHPDVPWSIVHRAKPSALLVPAIEETL
ncbi:MAG: NAD-binding protein, partial [Desulfuromonadaceae bacterium]